MEQSSLFPPDLPTTKIFDPLRSQGEWVSRIADPTSSYSEPKELKRMYRADGPETSKAAAQKAFPKTGTQAHEVLEAFKAIGERGFTDEELIEYCTLKNDNARKRRVDLYNNGWIQKTSETRLTTSDCEATVWRLA